MVKGDQQLAQDNFVEREQNREFVLFARNTRKWCRKNTLRNGVEKPGRAVHDAVNIVT